MSRPGVSVPAPRPWLVDASARIDGTSDRPQWALDPGAGGVLLLDRNENRDPVLASFIQSLVADLDPRVITDYGFAEPVRARLAADIGVEPAQIALGAGSEASIRDVFAAFVAAGDAVLSPMPTYIMVPVYCEHFGAELVRLEYQPSREGPALDVDKLCRLIARRRPRLVYLPNPNSPTGTILTTPDLRRVVEMAGNAGAVCLIDEAYYPFHDFTVVPWLADYPHLIVSRTFSKAWGMAGLRLGLLAGGGGIMSVMAKLRPLNDAGALTLATVDRLLDHKAQVVDSVSRLQRGKAHFCDAMTRLGLAVHPGHGNFCLVDFGAADVRVLEAMERVAVFRRVAHASMAGMQRITATTQELFDPVIDRIAAAIAVA